MTDAELYGCFAWERDAEHRPKLPIDSDTQSERQFFARHCQLNCITDPVVIGQLWAEKQAQRKAAAKHG